MSWDACRLVLRFDEEISVMIAPTIKTLFHDRRHGAQVLSERLSEFRDRDAVLMAIPRGGVITGAELSATLGLPLEIIPCRRIANPADSDKSIGSVSSEQAIIHQADHDIPQNYIQHQICMLQSAIKNERRFYYGDSQPAPLTDRTVIVVDDFIISGDTMVACLNAIRAQNPREIIIATPVMTTDAAIELASVVDDIIYIELIDRHDRPDSIYEDLRKITDDEARRCFLSARLLNSPYESPASGR